MSYRMPVRKTVDSQAAVLELAPGADEVIAAFTAGDPPPPRAESGAGPSAPGEVTGLSLC